ncbi:hypothetical protein [Alkalithermobacter paradoxus]|uniref:Uncharacterized protein n=1 Tax=Alkalithermobacter paradoxus TaxID=29349 RepID=A0A1V4I6P8_9FIRM|nr:hypothetical protein CLOTH_14050 [[Clostridium] thermoalcaliphilum]
MLKDIVKLNSDMQSSINLNLDYKDEGKKLSYIPTKSSIEVIGNIIASFSNPNRTKSKILIGPYGKGKSHLALYLIGMITDHSRSEKKYNMILNKALEVSNNDKKDNHYKSINNFINSKDKYLPVILNSTPYNNGFGDLLIYGLKKSLELNDLGNIRLDFYFDKAVDKIKLWQKDYLETYNLFERLLDEDINDFIGKLYSYNEEAYKKFEELYKQITSGAEFEPLLSANPISIYKDVNEKIKQYGYKGIFVFYDEFSKYIEYLVSNDAFLDIKLLQDFAEFCNRSKDQQVHLLLISHKNISQYTGNLEKNKIDQWKAIEGRFEEIQYNDFTNQQYELAAGSIKKDEKLWHKFRLMHKEKFENLKRNMIVRNLFKDLSDEEFENWIIYGAYPMNPITAYCLPRISEKVAQNERTLFSFLCKDETNSLSDYVKNNNREVKLDVLYDYFEDNIISLGYTDEIYKVWRKASNALEKLEEDLEKEIVKTIAILHIINNFSLLKPTKQIIKFLYNNEGLNALENLIRNNILIDRKTTSALDICNDIDIEIFTEIKNIKENSKKEINVVDFLNLNFSNIFIESRRHNDDNSIIRYFKVKFAEESLNDSYIQQDLRAQNSDGIVYIVNSHNIILNLDNERAIFIYEKIDKHVEEDIYDLWSIKKLKELKKEDISIRNELEVIERSYEEKVSEYIDNILNISKDSIVLYRNKEQNLSNKKCLRELASKIMDDIFANTPIINSEIINKNNPSKVVEGARKKIIAEILNPLSKTINFRKGSLESTILRSILLKSGCIHELENEGTYKLNYSILSKDTTYNNSFIKLVKGINEIIINSSEEVSFAKIYDFMILPEYKFGMKRGPIPIILGFILNKHKKYLLIKKDGVEVQISAEILEDIHEMPERFVFRLEEMTYEKEIYIQQLEDIFKEYINENDTVYDNLTYLTMGIKKWFLYLSKYAKDAKNEYKGSLESERISKDIIKFKNKLRILNENSIEFLFRDLKSIFNTQDYNELISKIKYAKAKIDGLTNNLYEKVESDIKKVLGLPGQISLNNGLYELIGDIDKSKKYSGGIESTLINFAHDKKQLNDSKEYLDKLSYILIGIYIGDWNDGTPNNFYKKLSEIKYNLESKNDTYKEDNEDIQTLEIAITSVELSDRGEMLLNDLRDTIEDYGNSISEEEKRQILIELLK